MFGFLKRYISKDKYYYNLIWKVLGVVPSNIELYKLALIHRSASIDADGHHLNNERLEFLGDAILQAITSELVFVSNPDFSEGEMTVVRSRLVSRANLNALAKHMNLENNIAVKPYSLLKTNSSILGDAFEAIVGALYLDKGYYKTSDVVFNLLQANSNISQVVNTERDFKSRIIEWAQKEHLDYKFETNKSENFTEASPSFVTNLYISSELKGVGTARNKKTSEQRAASKLYTELVNSGKIEKED